MNLKELKELTETVYKKYGTIKIPMVDIKEEL